MSRAKTKTWLLFLSLRWKAITCLVLTLIGAAVQLFPNNTAVHTLFGLITAIAATVGVHQAVNVGSAKVQDVVDAVTAVVSPAAAAEVAGAVTATTTGVLAGATGAVAGTVNGVVGGVLGDVTGLLDPPAPTND